LLRVAKEVNLAHFKSAFRGMYDFESYTTLEELINGLCEDCDVDLGFSYNVLKIEICSSVYLAIISPKGVSVLELKDLAFFNNGISVARHIFNTNKFLQELLKNNKLILSKATLVNILLVYMGNIDMCEKQENEFKELLDKLCEKEYAPEVLYFLSRDLSILDNVSTTIAVLNRLVSLSSTEDILSTLCQAYTYNVAK
jgi:hypothetical protein